jgi:hypothetical protein
MRKPTLTSIATATVLAAALMTGCGTGSDDHAPAAGTSGGQASATPATKQLAFGQPAEVLGYNLTKIRVTPTAVLYHRGPYTSGVDGPENGWFVAIAVKAEALQKPDTTAGGAGGGGFQWRGAGQTISGIDGNAVGTPWVGAVPEFGTDSPIEPGDPREGVETFDVPAKGGRLVYLSPEDHTITAAWTLPAEDEGASPAMVTVQKRIKEFS